MATAKKIIKNILETGFEAVKNTAEGAVKQVNETVGPTALMNAALNTPKVPNEMGEYLKNLGDPKHATPEAVAAQKQKDETETAKLRSFLAATPAHLRPSAVPQEPRKYEQAAREEMQKKQLAAQKPKQFIDAGGKKKGKLGQPMSKKANMPSMETGKDKKSG